MNIRVWITFAAIIASGCSKPDSNMVSVLVLDGWWNADFAKETCEQADTWHRENAALIRQVGCPAVTACAEMMVRVKACAVDPVVEVRDFESELATKLAADPACGGIQLVRFQGPGNVDDATADAMKAPHWSLQLQFVPGSRKQAWTMLRSPELNGYTKEEGDPKEIAKSVCAIIKVRGAAFVNRPAHLIH